MNSRKQDMIKLAESASRVAERMKVDQKYHDYIYEKTMRENGIGMEAAKALFAYQDNCSEFVKEVGAGAVVVKVEERPGAAFGRVHAVLPFPVCFIEMEWLDIGVLCAQRYVDQEAIDKHGLKVHPGYVYQALAYRDGSMYAFSWQDESMISGAGEFTEDIFGHLVDVLSYLYDKQLTQFKPVGNRVNARRAMKGMFPIEPYFYVAGAKI